MRTDLPALTPKLCTVRFYKILTVNRMIIRAVRPYRMAQKERFLTRMGRIG